VCWPHPLNVGFSLIADASLHCREPPPRANDLLLRTNKRNMAGVGKRAALEGTQMKNIDSSYVAIGASWLVLGMTLGIVMGATNNFQFMPVHAHINLIGFACHALFGMAYRQWPMMKTSSLAPYQFRIFILAAPITIIGLVSTLSGGPEFPTIIGSLGLLAGAALFCVMMWQVRSIG
jgi:hypothetical protein